MLLTGRMVFSGYTKKKDIVLLFEIRDRYMRCTRIKINCNTRVVRIRKTERAVHGPLSVRAWSVQYPFKVRSIVV